MNKRLYKSFLYFLCYNKFLRSIMSKEELREQLFNKHFNDGISITSFTENLSHIKDTWEQLHQLLENHVEYFDYHSSLDTIKEVTHNNKNYLIIKICIWSYIIIDLDNNRSLTEEDFKKEFNESFFVNNFNEKQEGSKVFNSLYSIDTYNGNIDELLDFYLNNKDTLLLPNKIYYRFFIDEAWTYLSINLTNGNIQLGFQTKDQYLYEQLFIKYDLTPSPMQDATNKIGKEKIQEMFSKIKDIKIPIEEIPEKLYKEYQKRIKLLTKK